MNLFLSLLCAALIALVGTLSIWRWMDHRADASERDRLLAFQHQSPALFDPAMVADLPEPARRYFEFSIAQGTPLYTVADLTMVGRFSLGTKDAPNYLDMKAKQTLAAPHGFIWKMQASTGWMRVSGSDSGTWTRFWLMGIVPVARMETSPDHRRSAFGRYAAEAIFWTPAALLPGPGISWEAIDDDNARVTISHDDLEQTIDLEVDETGRPTTVEFARWTNANPDGVFRLQPFGGHLSAFQTFGGFTVPTHVEAGNDFGTDAYFPFFIADVVDIQYPTGP